MLARSYPSSWHHTRRSSVAAGALVPASTMAFHNPAMPEPLFRATPSFEDLIVAVGERQDRSAFAALFAYFAPRVKAYLVRTGSESTTADELTQEVMLLVWRKAARYDPSQANAVTWIYTIARNKRIDRFRRDRHVDIDFDDPTLAPEPESPPDRRLETAQQSQTLSAAIASLPEEQAFLLRLAFYESKSHSMIASEVGLPLGTVKSRLRLALARLRANLGAEGYE
jgi:RNA polymerase sigma-70 factor (ECF subfamily)